MTNYELATAVQRRCTTKVTMHQVMAITRALFAQIRENIAAEGSQRIAGFGTFETRRYRARPGRNPRTGEAIRIREREKPVFRPAEALRQAVAPRAQTPPPTAAARTRTGTPPGGRRQPPARTP